MTSANKVVSRHYGSWLKWAVLDVIEPSRLLYSADDFTTQQKATSALSCKPAFLVVYGNHLESSRTQYLASPRVIKEWCEFRFELPFSAVKVTYETPTFGGTERGTRTTANITLWLDCCAGWDASAGICESLEKYAQGLLAKGHLLNCISDFPQWRRLPPGGRPATILRCHPTHFCSEDDIGEGGLIKIVRDVVEVTGFPRVQDDYCNS